MKLHLPVTLRKNILTCFAVATCTLYSGNLATAADVTLTNTDSLAIDYAEPSSVTDLEGGTLQLMGDTQLQLSNCGEGDGREYTLFTGVSALVDALGNSLTLNTENNAISNYFDTTLPGTGFWADSTLELTDDGTLQLVRHHEAVKDAVTITLRQTGGADYQYYAGVLFENVTATANGGAIYGDSESSINLIDNGSVSFIGNAAAASNSSSSTSGASARSYGGAIYGSSIMLMNNGDLTFSGNTARATASAYYPDTSASAATYGGAIHGSSIMLKGNGNVVFQGNNATPNASAASNRAYTGAYGGAVHGDVISLVGNESIELTGNIVFSSYVFATANVYGGAMCGGSITLDGNGSIVFSGNYARGNNHTANAYGGAIYADGNLSICNNNTVLFEKNAEVEYGTYCLRCIYAGGTGDVISLSAAEGKSIEFRDSVFINTGSTVNFNADYTDAAGIIHQQAGDIIFTGATTEDDLLAVKGSAGTDTEIANSRTTEVLTMTNLYGGRLRVEDGAIYRGYGITAMVDSYSTVSVRNATLRHSGYDLLFNSGTTLELQGCNTITGNLNMLDGSTLHVDFTGNDSVTGLGNSNLTLSGDMQLLLTGAGNGDGKTYILFTDIAQLLDKEGNVLAAGNYTVGDYFDTTRPGTGFWADATLQLTQDGTLQLVMHNEAVKEELNVTSHWSSVNYSYYKGISFIDNTYRNGGAIYGSTNSTITLINNGNVSFIGNEAYEYEEGGAIYGGVSSTITLSNNGHVNFSENTANEGGAIYGSTVTLSNNGSVSFRGNKIFSDAPIGSGGTHYSRGAAIYGSYVTLNNNDSVEFLLNSAFAGPEIQLYEDFAGHDGVAYGGAIDGNNVMLLNNRSVVFSGNRTNAIGYGQLYIAAAGGAIQGGSITINNNGSVIFNGNMAVAANGEANGGAIWGILTLSNNGSVLFSENSVSSLAYSGFGGAIWGNLSIHNNESVLFEKNVEKNGDTYRLRSFREGAYYDSFYSGAPTYLSAAVGKTIEFRDTVYTTELGNLYLNADYTDASGEVHQQAGDIIFTGEYTEKHLNEILETDGAGRKATEEEILASRTSEVKCVANLYNGRLIIKEGAVWSGSGITVASPKDSAYKPILILQNGTLSHSATNRNVVTIKSGATLHVLGKSYADQAILNLEKGSTFAFTVAPENATTAVLTLNSSTLTLKGAITLQLNAETGLNTDDCYILLTGVNEPTNWVNNITVTGGVWDTNDLTWINNTLYINVYKPKQIIWNNHSGDRLWNKGESINWSENETDLTYLNGVQVSFGDLGAGKVTLEGILAPSSVLVNSREDYSFEGTGSLTGGMSLTKQGSGTLTIATNNSYTGGTTIECGTLVAAHVNALGTGTVTMNGGTLEIGVKGLENTISSNGTSTLKITDSVTHILTGSITNSGTLILCGSFNASKLSKSKEWNSYVTVDNVVSTDGSGFLREGDFEVTIATGTVDSSSATVKYGEQKLVMNGGVGTGIGTMNYENYRILSGNTASSSAIHAYDNNAGKNALISLSEGGTLNADDADTVTLVNAAGGTINLSAGTLNGNIGGNTTVSVIGTGTIYGNNSYTGGTTIEGGRLEVDHTNALGTGTITLNSGTLDLNSYPVGNDIFATGGTLEGGDNFGGKLTVNGDLTLGGETTAGGGILLQGGSISGGSIVDTDITVNGSGDMEISSDIRGNCSLTLNNGDLTISGSNNNYTGGTIINKGNLTIGSGSSLGSGDITLNGGTLNTNGQEITNNIVNNGGSLISSYVLGKGHTLTVGKGGMSMVGNLTLAGGNLHFKGLPLTVDGKVTSTAPINVLVSGYSVIDKEGTIHLADFGDNTVGMTAASFNNVGYGTLSYDEAKNTLSITLTNKNIWVGGKGVNWVQGLNVGWQNYETFEAGNRVVFNTKGTVKIEGGVEPASVLVDIEKSLSFSTKYDKKTGLYSGAIIGDGCVVKRGVGKLTMNDGNTYSGGTFIEAGTVNAKGATSFGTGAITLSGGTLNLASQAVANDIVLSDSAIIKGGKKFLGSYGQYGGELSKGSVLNVAESATLSGGVVNGSLSGAGTVMVTGEVAIGTKGKIKTNALDISGTLAVSNKGLAMNTKTSAINVKTGGELLSEGAIKAAALTVDGGLVELHSAKASSIAVTNNMSLLNGADMTVYAKVKTANLTMADSQLHLGIPNSHAWAVRPTGGGSISPIPLSLSVSGSLKLTASALTLSGKIKAGNLEITDSYVNMTSRKLQTIAVKDTLTLTGDNSFIFDFDASNGKSYKLFTFKEFKSDGSALHELLGWENNGSYILKANDKNITLTVINASAWETYMDTLASGEAVATTSEDDELVASARVESAAFVLARPATEVDPMLGKVADTLVQSTWGTAGASRAFGDTIVARGTHATALADGKGAAWISTMGGSSRISSDGGHAGADYTLTGAAFGMEARLSEKSTVGLAIGNSWGKVSTFSAFPVDQDSTHQGIYGKHLLGSSTTLSWMAAHTRTESDAKLAGMACDWTQDALQLDARVDKLFAISDRTTVSAFVGMQYLATDKGECNGLSTGSLQNLRGEIGVSAAHKATDKAYIYGELSFIGDMVRHNPTATIGDYRSSGANPGRAGLNLRVGASYQLNDSWSLNGSYSLELMQNQTSHSANVGATYSF